MRPNCVPCAIKRSGRSSIAKTHVTVYPPGAELVFAALWRIRPDSVRWLQIVMAAADVLAGALLAVLLRALGQPVQRVLIYLWSPLVIFETAHSAHVDALVLPLLVGAWLMRVKGRDGWTGALLGAATALKLYPASAAACAVASAR